MEKAFNNIIELEIKHENVNNELSVNEIKNESKILIEDFLLKQFEEKCTVRDFRKMFIMLGLRKKFLSYAKSFTGMDEKNSFFFFFFFFFIQNHVFELLNNINHLAEIFEKEEEDKTNLKHLRRRKKIMEYANKFKKKKYYLTVYSLKSSFDGYTCSYREKN